MYKNIENFIKEASEIEEIVKFTKDSILENFLEREDEFKDYELNISLLNKINKINSDPVLDELILDINKNEKNSFQNRDSSKKTYGVNSIIESLAGGIIFKEVKKIKSEIVFVKFEVDDSELIRNSLVFKLGTKKIDKIKIGDERFLSDENFLKIPDFSEETEGFVCI